VLTREGGTHAVDLEVVPLKNLKERCFLVFFEPSGKRPKTRGKVATAPASAALQVEAPRGKKTDSRRIAALERDLSEAQDYLQSVQENQEIANEELQAANEEGQSANEELQSLNEELETSKEELESTNEELTTVNDEMVSRNTELDRLNSDLTNLQSSANLVIVLIGRDQVIRRFSPQAEKAFNLTMADVGRSVGVIRHNLDMPGVEAFVGEVVSTGRARECEVRHRDGRWYSLRVRPYLTAERKVDGAVLLLMDIDELKKTERLVNDARTQLARHAEELTRLVAERTGDLTATNRKLEALVTSSNQGKEEYRALFQASQSMQKKLRNLARQIITVQEEERKQISRELHDEVVQTLVAVNVELSALDKMSDGTLPLVKAKIAHTQRLVENSVDAVHRFARGLRPAVLDDLGLIPAIHSFCKTMADRKQIRIQINAFSGVEALGSAERTVLFRVAQEALTNVVRHAQAANVKLSIVAIRGGIRMEISDDGKAFDVNKTLGGKNNKRLGLVGMKERLEMVGGTLEMTSVAGTGTTVRAEIPFVPQRGRK
jgi:signal transduction histidine kinase